MAQQRHKRCREFLSPTNPVAFGSCAVCHVQPFHVSNVMAPTIPDRKNTGKARKAKETGGRLPGVPSYNRVEHVAIAAASLEASEKKQSQAAIDLCATAASLYASNLDIMIDLYGWPVVSTQKGGAWTVAKSKEARGQPQIVWNRWILTIKQECMNKIHGIWTEFLVDCNCSTGKQLPSGKTKEDADRWVRGMLWKKEQEAVVNRKRKRGAKAEVVDLEAEQTSTSAAAKLDPGAEGASAGAVNGDAAQEDVATDVEEEEEIPAMPDHYDGGPFYLTWKHYGPLGKGGEAEGDSTGAAVFADAGTHPHAPTREEQRASSSSGSATPGMHTPVGGVGGKNLPFGGASSLRLLSTESTYENLNQAYKLALESRRDRRAELKELLEIAESDEERTALRAQLRELINSAPPVAPVRAQRTPDNV